MTCQHCRWQLASNDRGLPPCDGEGSETPGHPAPLCPQCDGTAIALTDAAHWRCETCGQEGSVCLYWRSHGASPGEWVDPQDALAIDLHVQARDLGWPTVLALRTLELTPDEAELLTHRLTWLANWEKTPAPAQPGMTITESR